MLLTEPRLKIILSDSLDRTLASIDMNAHFDISNSNSLEYLIAKFKNLRESGLKEIETMCLQETDLQKTAVHPKLGELNLQNLIAAWVTHDLTHIAQITRIMAKQNKEFVGPFAQLLNILKA